MSIVEIFELFVILGLVGIIYETVAYIVSQWRMKHFDDSHWFEVDLPDGTTKRVKGADRRAFYLAQNKDAIPSNQVSIK